MGIPAIRCKQLIFQGLNFADRLSGESRAVRHDLSFSPEQWVRLTIFPALNRAILVVLAFRVHHHDVPYMLNHAVVPALGNLLFPATGRYVGID